MSYTIVIQHKDGITYSEDTTLCDGSLTETMDSRRCTIPSETFTLDPILLEWGDSVYIKVLATNIKGSGLFSLPGNGGIILRVPDVPVNLRDMPDVTTGFQIGLEWDEGANNGGTPVIDFSLAYAVVGNDYDTFEVGVTTRYHTATNLIPGTTYKFIVKARNAFGYSEYSEEVQILAAQEPDQPAPPTTTFNRDTV